jgi:surfeit locus 1 family protein
MVVAGLVALACVRLGFWQLDRLDERRERNAQVQSRMDEPARPVAGLRSDFADSPSDIAYRHAIVEGTYRPSDEFVSVGRAYGDLKGKLVATPLDLLDGSVLIVVRGIVPGDTPGPPAQGYETPTSPVILEGRLSAGEEPSRISEPAPVGGELTSLNRLDLDYVDEWIGGDVLPFALLLDTQVPQGQASQPVPIPSEELTEGSHLGYAVQWFAFGIIALAGGIGLVLRAGRKSDDQEPIDVA